MLSLSGQELSSPCLGWDVEQRQMYMLQLLHGGEEPLKHREGFVWGWVGSQERERWFGGICSHNWKLSQRAGGMWWLLPWSRTLVWPLLPGPGGEALQG